MPQSNGIVFRNVRVFPGHGEALSEPQDVRVEGATITSIEAASDGEPEQALTFIDGAGRVLMPGLIDAHCMRHSHPYRRRWR